MEGDFLNPEVERQITAPCTAIHEEETFPSAGIFFRLLIGVFKLNLLTDHSLMNHRNPLQWKF
jgi:hypothetical protein